MHRLYDAASYVPTQDNIQRVIRGVYTQKWKNAMNHAGEETIAVAIEYSVW